MAAASAADCAFRRLSRTSPPSKDRAIRPETVIRLRAKTMATLPGRQRTEAGSFNMGDTGLGEWPDLPAVRSVRKNCTGPERSPMGWTTIATEREISYMTRLELLRLGRKTLLNRE